MFTVHLVVIWDVTLKPNMCAHVLLYLFRVLEVTLWCLFYILPLVDEDTDKLYKISQNETEVWLNNEKCKVAYFNV